MHKKINNYNIFWALFLTQINKSLSHIGSEKAIYQEGTNNVLRKVYFVHI